jgi:hypothetical protein
MPIESFMGPGAFDSEAVAAMCEAFDTACNEIQEIDQPKLRFEVSAERIATRLVCWKPHSAGTRNLQIRYASAPISPQICWLRWSSRIAITAFIGIIFDPGLACVPFCDRGEGQRLGQTAMPINSSVGQGVFDPEATAAIGEAFDAACEELHCATQSEVVRELHCNANYCCCKPGRTWPGSVADGGSGGIRDT